MSGPAKEPWPVLAAIAALGAVLILAALALLAPGGREGAVLIILWTVPVSGVLAGATFFARKQNKQGLFKVFLIVELGALLGAAALTGLVLPP